MDNSEYMRILRERMQDPEVRQRATELYDAIRAAMAHENKYKAMTNLQLAAALQEGPWANTPLFTEYAELLEVVIDRLSSDANTQPPAQR